MPKKLNAKDLLKSLRCVGRDMSDNIHTLSESPIHILVYNEIMRFSKEELESVEDKYGQSEILYNEVLATRNEFLYSALLEKKAFTHLLNQDSQWLLEQVTTPSLDLYSCIYKIQYDRYKRRDEKHFISCVVSYLQKMDTPEKEKIAPAFYNNYVKKYHKELVVICFDGINDPVTDYLLGRLKEDKIDINEQNLMNDFLPKPEWRDNSESKFFISSVHIEKIKSCLKKGFRYDEDNYYFIGKTLMTALLKSERVDLVLAILPYLKRLEPKAEKLNGEIKHQDLDSNYELLNLYRDKKEFQEIKMIFYQLVYKSYDEKLKEKPLPDSLKIKI